MLFAVNYLLGLKSAYGRISLVILIVFFVVSSSSCGNHQKSPLQENPPVAQRTLAGLPPQSWTSDNVASLQQPGSYSTIANGPDGVLHIAYYDSASADLKHAYFQNSIWTTESVDTVGDVGKYCSIDVNASNTIYIAYFDETTWSLKVATHPNGGSWSSTIVDGPHPSPPFLQRYPMQCSLDCDSTGKPCIAYVGPESGIYIINYAEWTGLVWQFDVANPNCWCPIVSLALGPDDVPYIAHVETMAGIEITTKEGGSWVTTGIDSGGFFNCPPGIAFDSSGVLHLTYAKSILFPPGTTSRVVHSWLTQNGYAYENVAYCAEGDYYTSTSLKADDSGDLYVSYATNTSGLWFARTDEVGWVKSCINPARLASPSQELTLDVNGSPHVGYQLSSDNTLQHGHLGASGWHHTEIQNYGPGQYTAGYINTSLDISDSFTKAISFHDEYEFNLGLAIESPGDSWATDTLDSDFFSGELGTSARYNSDGLLGVAYYCFDNNDGSTLRFAEEQPDGSYVIQKVAELPVWGGLQPSLAYAPDGSPAIAWCGMEGGNIVYSRRYNGAWIHATAYNHINYGDRMAIGPSLAFNSDGEPTIGFAVISPNPLEWPSIFFTERISNPYHWELTPFLDQGDFTMQSVSLAYDSEYEPAIAYVDRSNSELRLLRRSGGLWDITSPLTSYPDVCNSVSGDGGASLRFDDSGVPNIALAIDSIRMHSIALAFWDPDTQIWVYAPAANQVFSPEGVSLAFDPNGYPSIAFSACYTANPLEKRALRIVEWR